MYRSMLLLLLCCTAVGCALPTDVDSELELGGSEAALYYGDEVTSRPPGSFLNRIVTVTESYAGSGGASSKCTGTYITSRWIVTAAHCVEKAGNYGVFVWIDGASVKQVIRHPQFRRNAYDAAGNSEIMAGNVADIALIEVDAPINRAFASPLPIYRYDLPAGTPLQCYGYGLSYPDAPASDYGTLRHAELRTRVLTYTDDDPLSPRVGFTVGTNGNQAIAPGDSGGPCFYFDGSTYWLAGIHSTNTLANGRVETSDEVAPGMYYGWLAAYLANEITMLRVTHRNSYGGSSDVTTQASNVIFSPDWMCTGQQSCNYPVDYLGLSDTSTASDLTINWRCGLYDFSTYSMNVAGPLDGKVASFGCPTTSLSGIQIWSATYGGNCGAPQGNQTLNLASRCGGRTSCSYAVRYWEIGDPVPGCAKTYDVRYSCGNGSMRSLTLPAEAGFGSQLTIDCLPVWNRPWRF